MKGLTLREGCIEKSDGCRKKMGSTVTKVEIKVTRVNCKNSSLIDERFETNEDY